MFGLSMSLSTPVKVSLVIGSTALLLFGASQLLSSYNVFSKDDDDSDSNSDSNSDSESSSESEN